MAIYPLATTTTTIMATNKEEKKINSLGLRKEKIGSLKSNFGVGSFERSVSCEFQVSDTCCVEKSKRKNRCFRVSRNSA